MSLDGRVLLHQKRLGNIFLIVPDHHVPLKLKQRREGLGGVNLERTNLRHYRPAGPRDANYTTQEPRDWCTLPHVTYLDALGLKNELRDDGGKVLLVVDAVRDFLQKGLHWRHTVQDDPFTQEGVREVQEHDPRTDLWRQSAGCEPGRPGDG